MHTQHFPFLTALTARVCQLLGVGKISEIKQGEVFFFVEKKEPGQSDFTSHMLFFEGASHDYFSKENQLENKKGWGDEKLTFLLSGSHRVEIERFENGAIECHFVEYRNGTLDRVSGAIFFGQKKQLLSTEDNQLARHSQH